MLLFGQWQHIALSVDSETGAMAFYVNGMPMTTTQLSYLPPMFDANQNHNFGVPATAERDQFYIGRAVEDMLGDEAPEYFSGKIQSLATFERLLSPGEVAQLFGAQVHHGRNLQYNLHCSTESV